MQELLGPAIDIELVDPPDKVPQGVVIGIKHFLSVPNSSEIEKEEENSEESGHRHYVVRMIKANGKYELDKIDHTTLVRFRKSKSCQNHLQLFL